MAMRARRRRRAIHWFFSSADSSGASRRRGPSTAGCSITALSGRWVFIAGFLAAVLCSFALVPYLGRNFFPPVESTQIALHVRAPTGLRIEETAVEVDRIEAAIRKIIPPHSLRSIVDNIGLPISGINMAYANTGSIGASDADILITLHDGREAEAPDYVKAMREQLPALFPGTTFAFLPADIVTQILNFGLPAPIDVQIIGSKLQANRAYADKLLAKIARVPGIADARIQQAFNAPTLNVNVDRTRAQIVGVSERDVAQNLQNVLAGSSQTAPTFWLNPKNGVSYPIVAQTPQYWVRSLSNPRERSGFPRIGGQADPRRRRFDQTQRQRRSRLALRRSTCYRYFRDQ